MARAGHRVTFDTAESLALEALAFLTADARRLQRFLSLTGLSPQRLTAEAEAPATLAAVLEHFSGDESLLLVFTASGGHDPSLIAPALAVLRAAAAGTAPP